jgi:hypothetical protein
MTLRKADNHAPVEGASLGRPRRWRRAYLRRDLAVACRQHIETSPALADSERTAVLGGTAAKLIPRLASLVPKLEQVTAAHRDGL